MNDTADALASEIAAIADPAVAVTLQSYFKTGPGDYGEGDIFVGVRVPAMKKVAKQFEALPFDELRTLIDSEIHEHRATALGILVLQFKRASKIKTRDEAERARICGFYLDAVYRQRVNNWDLVDSTAEFILGEYLLDKPRDLLLELAASQSLWERRVSVLATFSFLKQGDASTSLAIADMLLTDKHDLMHKAVGWMLRELGWRVDRQLLLDYLEANAARMPRTMLSYATEHLDPEQRLYYRKLR
ncbi:DNA alkylation repair protein [soil metagenome]